jgi:hypothetical protein
MGHDWVGSAFAPEHQVERRRSILRHDVHVGATGTFKESERAFDIEFRSPGAHSRRAERLALLRLPALACSRHGTRVSVTTPEHGAAQIKGSVHAISSGDLLRSTDATGRLR